MLSYAYLFTYYIFSIYFKTFIIMALLIMGELDYGPLISHQIYPLIFKVIVYFLMRPFHVGDWGRGHRERTRSRLTITDIHAICMRLILLLFFGGLVDYLLVVLCGTLVGLPTEVLAHEGHLENFALVIIY
jgi:hypothetical protein